LKDLYDQNLAIWLRTIAGLEVVGGLWGIVIALWQMMTIPLNAQLAALIMAIVCLYALSIVAGVGLWLDHSFGCFLSIIVQAIQLPKLLSSQLIFFFSVGFDIYFYWTMFARPSHLMIDIKVGAYHQIFFNSPGTPFGLGMSVPACIFLVKLLKCRSIINKHQVLRAEDNYGDAT
jgi:hypothetical protein